MDQAEQTKLDMRTREGRAMAASLSSISPPAAPAEIETPSGKRITRDTRRGFGNQGQKLAYPEREGYHRHWFNDSPGRVATAQESGYTPVNDPATGKPVTRVVGTHPNGSPLYGYLLEIPQEWFDDDMAELEKINASKEEAIKGGAQAKESKDAGHFYPSAQGRRLEIGRGPLRR